MRFTIAQYAHALANAIEHASGDEIKTIARNTARLLRQRKHTSKLPAILREARRRYFYKKKVPMIDVISAAPLLPATRREIRRIAGARACISEAVRPRAIAGITIIVNSAYRIDATAEGIIQNLFTKHEKRS